MRNRKILASALVLTVTLTLGSAVLASDHASRADKSGPADIVDTAVAAGQFGALVRAVEAAGLVDTLKGPGPFTVFAPTDAAFAKLPEGTLESLIQDPEQLRSLLTYHVVPGRYLAADVAAVRSAKTVHGSTVRIRVEGGVRVDNANVVTTDIVCSNGVIHVIDAVITPGS